MRIGFDLRLVSLPAPLRRVLKALSVYVFPSIVGLIVIILLLGVIRPRVGEILRLRTKNTESKQKVDLLEKKLSTLRSFDQNQLTADVEKVEIALPSTKDLPSLLSNFERIAQDSQVSIAAVQTTPGQIGDVTGKNEVDSFPVKVTIAGNFSQIKSFLGKIIAAPRVLSTRTLGVDSALSGQVASLSATVDIDSYFLAAATIQFAVEEPLQPITAEEAKILADIIITPETVAPTPTPVPVGKADPFAP